MITQYVSRLKGVSLNQPINLVPEQRWKAGQSSKGLEQGRSRYWRPKRDGLRIGMTMQKLGTAELLSIWEQLSMQTMVQRVLGLLTLISDEPIEHLARLSIGCRDSRLLTLREAIFGQALSATVRCPRCSENLELNFRIDDIRVDAHVIGEQYSVIVEDYEVEFRLPNSLDLNAVADANSMTSAHQILLERCLLTVSRYGEPLTIADLPQSVMQLVSEQMSQADPQSEIELAMDCPTCGHVWCAQFDIATFFWTELNAWSQRILWEVHSLARYYGWFEADILNMSPLRRQMYLEMAGSS